MAYVQGDDRSVVLQHIFCDPRDGLWNVSKQYPLDEVRAAHGDNDIVHLSWSRMGNELAIIDLVGRISVWTVFLATNRLTIMRRTVQDPEDNLGSVVGMMWFFTEKPERQVLLLSWKPSVNQTVKLLTGLHRYFITDPWSKRVIFGTSFVRFKRLQVQNRPKIDLVSLLSRGLPK